MSPYNFDRTYDKWNKLIRRANLYIAILSVSAGIIEYFILQSSDLFVSGKLYYIFRYIAAPIAYHVIVIGVGYWIMKKFRFAERHGDYVPMIQLTLLCAGNSITNYEYPIVSASLCFPIFVSIVFDNPKMTRDMWLISYVGLGALYAQRCFARYFRGVESPQLTLEMFVTASILLAAYITGRIVAQFQAEKKEIMESMHQHELKLREELNKCPKTGLLNASAFQNKLYRETEKSRFTGWPLLLTIIDIDDFKKVNENYGHAKGDKVLILVAEMIKKHFKEEEFPSRFGGEEFTIMVRRDTVADLKSRIEAMNRDFQAQLLTYMEEPLTISAGIAEWKFGMTDDQLFDCADKALARAKNMGRNRIVVWSDAYEKI